MSGLVSRLVSLRVNNMGLDKLNFLIAGQLKTSRTETIENYYRDKVNCLGVIGISNPYAVKGLARCTLYEKGKKINEFPLKSIHLKGTHWFNQILMIPIFSLYLIGMLNAVFKLKRKFDVFIGVACFSTLFGILLKKIGLVDKVIYYTLDYYPLPRKWHINTIINKIIWHLDKYCCKRVSLVWNISPRIIEAREKLMNFSREEYNYMPVPLTYGEGLLRYKKREEIDEDTLVFVGTISQNQGLEMVIEAMPQLIKRKPRLKVEIIGRGPSQETIKKIIKEKGLQDRFVFHGFVEDEEEVLSIISRCAVGLCTWTDDVDNNAIYADPGKPKLYAFCGIPMVITNVTAVAEEIHKTKAGIAIDYDKSQFVDAVLKILDGENSFEQYRQNSYAFAKRYTTEAVFENVNQTILDF